MEEWYIIYNGQQVGPMTKEQLLSYDLNSQSKVWREGMADWADAFTIPELMELASRTAPRVPNVVINQTTTPASQPVENAGKSKVVAGILAILFGSLGVQYFYINKPVAGILSFLLVWILPIIVGLFTCGGGFFLYGLSLLVCLMYFVQGIMMFFMSDEDFDRRFPNSPSFWPFF